MATTVQALTPVTERRAWLASLHSHRAAAAIAAVVIVSYFALALGTALSRRPWSDEGWFASPALNLATNGSMGSPVLDSSSWLPGINQYTYWVLPLHLLTQAGWYKLFGFSLLSLRMLSAFCGLVTLAAVFVIVRRLADDYRAALFTSTLLAVDYSFVMGAAFGRMDMMCAALGFTALAAYLSLREKHFAWAVIVSHTLVAASGLTHFNGILHFAGLIFLTLYFDRRRIEWRTVALAAVPYVVGAMGWGLYILQDPAVFAAQFKANATTGGRLQGLSAPWLGFIHEFTERYRLAFGLGEQSPGHSSVARLKALILVAYVVGVIGAFCTRRFRRHRGLRALLAMTAIYFVIMAVLDGQKLAWYLVHILPLYAALLALWLSEAWHVRRLSRWAIAGAVAALLLLQVGGVAQRIRTREYQTTYALAADFLKHQLRPSTLIMGSAEMGFALGFNEHLIDDSYLGYYSGKRPDFIVVDEIYATSFRGSAVERPAVYDHINRLLTEQYRLVYDQGLYRIYAVADKPLAMQINEPTPIR
jgi:4-amino-4-deoxy-L-arabinose transferase-like glycosyltransferase